MITCDYCGKADGHADWCPDRHGGGHRKDAPSGSPKFPMFYRCKVAPCRHCGEAAHAHGKPRTYACADYEPCQPASEHS